MQVSLFIFVLAHAMGKLTTIPLLLKMSPAALSAYLAGVMVVYLLYKLARRDFQYWVPTAGVGLSLVSRVLIKLYADFSGNPQFRHPFEIGGAAYLLMLCETQGALVASTIAYSRLYAEDDRIDDMQLLTALAILVGTWATRDPHSPSGRPYQATASRPPLPGLGIFRAVRPPGPGAPRPSRASPPPCVPRD